MKKASFYPLLLLFVFLLSSCSSLPAAQVKALEKYKADKEECIKKPVAHPADVKKSHNACMKEKGYQLEEEQETGEK